MAIFLPVLPTTIIETTRKRSYFLRKVLDKTAVSKLPALECGDRRPSPVSNIRLIEDLRGLVSSGGRDNEASGRLDFLSVVGKSSVDELLADPKWSTFCSCTFNRKLTERLNSLAVRNGLVRASGELGVDLVTSAQPSLTVLGIWSNLLFFCLPVLLWTRRLDAMTLDFVRHSNFTN